MIAALTCLLAAAEFGGLIGLLVWLLILAIVVYVIFLILGMLPIPEPVRTILCLVIGLAILLVIIQRLGLI